MAPVEGATHLDVIDGGNSSRLTSDRPKPLAKEPPKSARSIVDDNFNLPEHPGFGATPQRLRGIFLEAECGWPQTQVDLFADLIENDGHLRGLIEGRINAVAGKHWELQPGGKDQASIDAAGLLEEKLRTANVHELLWHQLEYNYFGFSNSEISWDYQDGLFYPCWFHNVPHRRFVFPDGQPRLLTQKNSSNGEELLPGGWVTSRARGGNVGRAGLLRTCAWFALFKRYAIRDWVVAAEKFGIPYVTGKYNSNADKKTRDTLEDALTKLGTDGVAVFEDLVDVEIISVDPKGGGQLHGGLIALCEAQISKTITGATLTADTGQANTGSWALGKVHSGVRFDLIQNDAEMVAQVTRRCIGEPFMRFNGLPGKAPILRSQIAQEIDQRTRIEIQQKAHEMGVPLSLSQFYEDHALKAPTSPADTLAPAGTQGEQADE